MTKTIEQLQKQYDAFLIAHELPDESADDLLYMLTWSKPRGMSHMQRAGLCEWLLKFSKEWRDAQ
jgi:hypothetical protein